MTTSKRKKEFKKRKTTKRTVLTNHTNNESINKTKDNKMMMNVAITSMITTDEWNEKENDSDNADQWYRQNINDSDGLGFQAVGDKHRLLIGEDYQQYQWHVTSTTATTITNNKQTTDTVINQTTAFTTIKTKIDENKQQIIQRYHWESLFVS